jgi:hypothetical protein
VAHDIFHGNMPPVEGSVVGAGEGAFATGEGQQLLKGQWLQLCTEVGCWLKGTVSRENFYSPFSSTISFWSYKGYVLYEDFKFC